MYRKKIGQILTHTLTSDEMAAKRFLLDPPPPEPTKVYALMKNSPPMLPPNDFIITGGNMLNFAGKAMDGVVLEGDMLFVIYNA
jgi:hypothetical protein